MVRRRELVSGGIVAGLATLTASSSEVAPAFDDEKTAHAISRLRESFERQLDQVYPGSGEGSLACDTSSERG